MTDQRPRRVGWGVVALGAAALGAFGLYLVNAGLGIGPGDQETWGYVAVLVSPILAAGSAVAVGVLLMLVAAFRLVDVPVVRAAKATGWGCLLAPVLFVLSFFGLLYLLDEFHITASWYWPWFVLGWPIAIGVATVIVHVLPTNTLRANETELPASVDDPEKVLEKTLHDKTDPVVYHFGIELPNEPFEVTLEIALGVPRAFEFLSAEVGRLGRVLAEDRSEKGASLQAVVGAGFLNQIPAVVTVRMTAVDPSRSRVVISGIAKEGPIKQRAAEGAVRRILKAANLPAPAR